MSISLKDSKFANSVDFISEMRAILRYYGFCELEELLSEKPSASGAARAKAPKTSSLFERDFVEMGSLIAESGLISGKNKVLQIMSFKTSKGIGKNSKLGIQIIGVKDPFAEAMSIAMLKIICSRLLDKEIVVELNSLGDKDSAEKYMEDMSRFLKKRKKNLPASLAGKIDEGDITSLLKKLQQSSNSVLKEAPTMMDYLSDEAQKHLYALLDYLEQMNIGYNLNPYLFGNMEIWKHVLFKIYLKEDTKKPIALGGRYDHAVEKMGKNAPSVAGLFFFVENKGRKTKLPSRTKEKQKSKKKIFFIQIGLPAKAQAVNLLSALQSAGMDVEHTVSTLSLVEQYKMARKAKADYVIILGHKEAIDGAVIVRDEDSQAQKLVKQDELVKYLKSLTGKKRRS